MTWWTKKRAPETVTADWMGEKLAEVFDPRRSIPFVIDAHPVMAKGDAPIVAIASLRLVGFQLGAMQESVRSRINCPVMERIQLAFVATMVKTYADSFSRPCNPYALTDNLLKLGKKVHDAFMAHRQPDPASGPHPSWFAGKEVCVFLTSDPNKVNPDEVMSHAELLHRTTITTKKLFDELSEMPTNFVIS